MTIFLPCRAGSQRIENKNTRLFAGIEGGLLRIKLSALLQIEEIDQILVSTNDLEVIQIAKSLNSDKIQIDKRPEHLASSETSTDDLIKYVPSIIEDEHILWTHVTSPFLSNRSIISAIQLYQNNKGSDSVMSVNRIQTFLWNKSEPVNYDRKIEKWPRTQTIDPLFEINSGFFINSRTNYIKYNDRIGSSPFLYATDKLESMDIDWPEDFELAEMLYKQRIGK